MVLPAIGGTTVIEIGALVSAAQTPEVTIRLNHELEVKALEL